MTDELTLRAAYLAGGPWAWEDCCAALGKVNARTLLGAGWLEMFAGHRTAAEPDGPHNRQVLYRCSARLLELARKERWLDAEERWKARSATKRQHLKCGGCGAAAESSLLCPACLAKLTTKTEKGERVI